MSLHIVAKCKKIWEMEEKNSTFEEDVLCILLGAKSKNQAFETLAYFISET